MRCVHADSPPPKLDKAICRKQAARSNSVTSAGGSSAAARAGSLMQEMRVVRQLALVMLVRLQWVGRLVGLRLAPVVLEHLVQALDDVGLVHDDAELAAQI